MIAIRNPYPGEVMMIKSSNSKRIITITVTGPITCKITIANI